SRVTRGRSKTSSAASRRGGSPQRRPLVPARPLTMRRSARSWRSSVVPEKARRAIEVIDQVRSRRPTNRQELERWVLAFTGVRVPGRAVCRGHSAPLDMFARQVLDRPALALWHGPRGSGKSFLSAIDTHLASRFHPRHETRILGGSLAQSEQIHQALREAVLHGRGPTGESDAGSIARLLKREGHYHNGSKVSILSASRTPGPGPPRPSFKSDK